VDAVAVMAADSASRSGNTVVETSGSTESAEAEGAVEGEAKTRCRKRGHACGDNLRERGDVRKRM